MDVLASAAVVAFCASLLGAVATVAALLAIPLTVFAVFRFVTALAGVFAGDQDRQLVERARVG